LNGYFSELLRAKLIIFLLLIPIFLFESLRIELELVGLNLATLILKFFLLGTSQIFKTIIEYNAGVFHVGRIYNSSPFELFNLLCFLAFPFSFIMAIILINTSI
jgi:hypothetical protein